MNAKSKWISFALGALISAFICFFLIIVTYIAADIIEAKINTPQASIRAFFDAWAAHDVNQMLAQIDPDERPSAQDLESNFTLRVTNLADMKYETTSDDGSKAIVRVTGTVNFELSGEKRQVPLNATITLIRKYGRWYLQIKR